MVKMRGRLTALILALLLSAALAGCGGKYPAPAELLTFSEKTERLGDFYVAETWSGLFGAVVP